MREEWAAAFTRTAEAFWTDARTRQVTGGNHMAILPREAPVLLRSIGLLHRDGSMPPKQVRKYRQINHMIAVLGPSLRELRDRFEVVHLLDAGCGRSYLTMLLAWVFVHTYAHPVRILGIDRSEALIDECRRRTALTGLDGVLAYATGALSEVDVAEVWRRAFGDTRPPQLHGVISLHACDTATDDAIALGLAEQVEMLAVAPCCQAELADKWLGLNRAGATGAFEPLWSMPHLRRKSAATLTDTFRTLLIRAAGYDTTALEFVGTAHTPKNTLIRGMRRGLDGSAAARRYVALRRATGDVGIALEQRVPSPARDLLALGEQGAASRAEKKSTRP